MSRSVNKVILIGNLTKAPEVRYTPQGTAVASFGLATNREWMVDGSKKEAVDFHNVVAWNKLAELCGQLLTKGTKVYVEGRLQTRDWMDPNGNKKYKTEVVIDEMIILTNKRQNAGEGSEMDSPEELPAGNSHNTGTEEELNLDDVLSQDFGETN